MTTKSTRTRALLVETALAMFRERGYEATTMREIAARAAVSPGNAYYYFAGKNSLVQELYDRIQVEHRGRAEPLLRRGAPLADNLGKVLHAGLDTMADYHSFGSTMVHVALKTSSSVSPFSPQSTGARAAAIALFEDTVAASKGVPAGPLRPRLPHLLWLLYLGITLHWVIDSSPGQRRTRALIDGLVPIVGRTLTLARLPVARGLVTDLVALMDHLDLGADAPTREV